MNRRGFSRNVLVAVTALLVRGAFGLSGSGDSSAGSLDTVAPVPGTATIPPTGTTAGELIPYAGGSDDSGIARIELWVRPESVAWGFSASNSTIPGVFYYTPSAAGLYYFDLVAEDVFGNRSAAPAGSTGVGQGSTLFTAPSSVGDWEVFK